MSTAINRQWLLASRPHGKPSLDDFRFNEATVPSVGEGQVLLRNRYLSLDPYMRGRMSDAESYADPVAIGDVMVGGTVAEVVVSRHADFSAGDLVVAFGGWQDYALSNGEGLLKLPKEMAHPSYALGVLGMPGFTAYMGLLDIGQPQAGETIVVAAASGAVGANVGQIGKIKGARVVGVAGSAEKCAYVVDELGFDACLNHRDPDFAAQLKAACPEGIDVYFESVGGKVFDAVLPLLNTGARIPLCGLISQYNLTELPAGPDRSAALMGTFLKKRITVKGFIIFDDYGHRYGEFARDMQRWVNEGKVRYREDRTQDLANAPQTFIDLLDGKNFGKVVIAVH